VSAPTEQDFRTTYATLRYLSAKHHKAGSDDWIGVVEGMRQTIRAALDIYGIRLDEDEP